jgi:Flp pilus assembly protein TadG
MNLRTIRNRRADGARESQTGQAMVEYTICALLLILALFTPFSEGKSVADMLAEAVKKNHQAKVYAIGNPATGSSKGF